MKKLNKSILFTMVFLLSLGMVNAATLPTGSDLPIPLSESSRGTWANTYNSALNNTFVILDRIFTTTGFLRSELNLTLNSLNLTGILDLKDNNIISAGLINNINISKIITSDLVKLGSLTVSATELNFVAGLNSAAVGVNNLSILVPSFEQNPSNATIQITEGQISNLQNYLTSTINESIAINGIRLNNITGEEQFLSISGSLTGIGDGSNNAKTWVIKASATRPAGSNTINGDFDDALFKGSITNKATANEANYIMRGLNIGATNRDGGNVNKLNGGHISSTQKGSSNVVTDLWGLSVKVESDSPNTAPTNVFGINVEYDMVAPTGTPTLSAGVRVVENSDLAIASSEPLAGFMVDNGAADRQWQYGLYIDDTTVTKADIRLSTGVLIISGSGEPNTGAGTVAPRGSLFMQTNGTMYVKEQAADTGWVSK